MIFEGVKLMVVGMTTVMLFLLLMIYFIKLVAFLTRGARRAKFRRLPTIEPSWPVKEKKHEQYQYQYQYLSVMEGRNLQSSPPPSPPTRVIWVFGNNI